MHVHLLPKINLGGFSELVNHFVCHEPKVTHKMYLVQCQSIMMVFVPDILKKFNLNVKQNNFNLGKVSLGYIISVVFPCPIDYNVCNDI